MIRKNYRNEKLYVLFVRSENNSFRCGLNIIQIIWKQLNMLLNWKKGLKWGSQSELSKWEPMRSSESWFGLLSFRSLSLLPIIYPKETILILYLNKVLRIPKRYKNAANKFWWLLGVGDEIESLVTSFIGRHPKDERFWWQKRYNFVTNIQKCHQQPSTILFWVGPYFGK